jgi:hypothetical protein
MTASVITYGIRPIIDKAIHGMVRKGIFAKKGDKQGIRKWHYG